jgi:hypothetical protein
MFTPSPSSFRSRLVLVGSLVAVLAAAPSVVWAQDKSWTTVGSGGTVDDDSLSVVTLVNAIARVREGAPAGTVGVIRYNVVAVDGLFGDRGVTLTARFFDREDTDRVVISLKRIELDTGAISTLVTLDSDAFDASDQFQVESVCNEDVRFDFFRLAYWVEVSLTKSKGPRRVVPGPIQPLLAPAISMVQIAGFCGVVPG